MQLGFISCPPVAGCNDLTGTEGECLILGKITVLVIFHIDVLGRQRSAKNQTCKKKI